MAMIRKQYHFRPSANGYYAWDVAKLVELTAGSEVQQVPLSEIEEIDEAYWFGAPGDIASCRRIAEHAKQIEEVDLSFPIILCPKRRVMDGMHRVLKALNEGRVTIDAFILQVEPPPDFEDVYPHELPT